jgi:hypothetical protein
MKRLFVCLAVLALSAPAFAADIAKNEDVYIEGVPGSYSDDYGRGNALVASIIQGTFTDVGPYFQTAMDSHGLSTDIIYDPFGVWPPMDDYLVVCVSTADMWWSYNWAPDEAILASYMDNAGKVMLVGQDYIYSRGDTYAGFPNNYLGVCGFTGDLNWDATVLYTEGVDGGPMNDMDFTIYPCFEANMFFTDEIIPCATGLSMWTSHQIFTPVEGGCSTPAAIFSSIAFGCLQQSELNDVMCRWLQWLDLPSPAETSTWGSVKELFR